MTFAEHSGKDGAHMDDALRVTGRRANGSSDFIIEAILQNLTAPGNTWQPCPTAYFMHVLVNGVRIFLMEGPAWCPPDPPCGRSRRSFCSTAVQDLTTSI